MNHGQPKPGSPMLTAAMGLGAALVIVGAAGSLTLGDQAGVATIWLTGAAAYVGSVLGLVPAAVLSRQRRDGLGLGFLIGTLPRLVAAGVAAWVLIEMGVGTARWVVGCVAGWYLVFLVIEVAMLVVGLARAERAESEPLTR